MDKVNQLIAKAMSTDSDKEALACLRKAKKLMGDKTYQGSNDSGLTEENFVKIQNIAQRWKSECQIWRDLYYAAENKLKLERSDMKHGRQTAHALNLFLGGMCLMLFFTLLVVSM